MESKGSNEAALVARAQSGDQAALRSLLMQHSDALYSRIILPRVGNAPVAEDILKATMLTAIEKLDSFQWRDRSVYFWLRQIAANKVIDYHRSNQRSRKLVDRLQQESLPQTTPGPERALIAAQERQLNAKINPRYQKAIKLRLIEEESRQICAEQLDVSEATFDVIFYRAIRAFRKEFGKR
jgi:RNA polymerase sigma-70 factor (ECF subfamily)